MMMMMMMMAGRLAWAASVRESLPGSPLGGLGLELGVGRCIYMYNSKQELYIYMKYIYDHSE